MIRPDPNATGASRGLPAEHREIAERDAAWQRGQLRAQRRSGERGKPSDGYIGPLQGEESLRLFAALAENVRDYAVFLLDPDGLITYWGEGARLMKWWSRDETEGGHLRMLYLDGGSEDGTAEEHLQQAAERGEYTGEGQRMRNDGSTFWAGVTLTALRDPDNRTLVGFVKMTRDLTAWRAAEARRKEAQMTTEEANRIRGESLTTLSHEIRTPINAILGYADLLELKTSESSISEEQRAQIERIRSSSKHLLGLVNDVLDLSRMDAHRMPVSATAGLLGPAVQRALILVQPQAQAKGLSLADHVSSAAAQVPYLGDEERVRQILVNLLGNAVKFTPSGGRITLSAGTAKHATPGTILQGPGPWAWVRVEDTGPGIPADRLAAIFEPFEQVDATHVGPDGGSGLGITISLRLARLMNGDLIARSELGRGSSFFLWLPAAAGAEPGNVEIVED